MRLALVTTPATARSGIGDYTRHLLPYLREEVEVELFVDVGLEGDEPSGGRTRPVDELVPRDFDQVVYQLGNERQHAFMLPMIRGLGGTVMLHDWVLFDLALAAHPELERGGALGLRRALQLGGPREARVWSRNLRGAGEALPSEALAGLGVGWHAAEEGGRWSAPRATLQVGTATHARLEIGACTGKSWSLTQGRKCLARGEEAARCEVALGGVDPLHLDVRSPRATSEQRERGDARSLGLFVQRVELREDGEWRELDLATATPSAAAGLSRDRFRLPLNRGVVRHADAFLVHSDWMGEAILASRNDNTPIARVHHGCERRWRDEDRRALRPESRRDAFVVASLGALQAHKRVEVLLRALARARRERPQLELVCVGEARPSEVDHARLVRELGLEGAVHVTGWVPEEQAWGELHAADLCVNLRGPSTGGTSGGLCQALSLGRAVITSDLPELAHLPGSVLRVSQGEGEVEALARLLVDLSGDPRRLAELEAEARRAVDEELHWSHAARRYVEALASFPKARAARRSLLVRFYHATRRAEVDR